MTENDKKVIGTGLEFQSPNKVNISEESSVTKTQNGWNKPLPDKLPKPGYWPFIMAMGIAFILWGLAVGFNEVVSTIILISGIGLILFIIALAGWIGDVRDERRDKTD